ncbi:MAG TPA: hypothetical protein VH165_05570 [Kofleriaceae bacterium]|nr:hypothetical protein [Kofleriaceae bacterium]
MALTERPVWTVVLLSRPGGNPPEGTGIYRIRGIGDDAFVFRYRVVPIWRLDAHEMRAYLGLAGAPFLVAMRGADEEFVRDLTAEVQADHTLSVRDRADTLALLYLVSAAILGSETARRIFHVDWLIQDPNVQELIAEWEEKGVARGEARGLAQGLAKGLAEGRAKALLESAWSALYRVLELRSFPITSDIRARVDGELSVDRLTAWHDAAVTARTIDDVFRNG